jgi:hypothetical protein
MDATVRVEAVIGEDPCNEGTVQLGFAGLNGPPNLLGFTLFICIIKYNRI